VGPIAAVGIAEVEALLARGLPIGATTELTGPECSGRSSLALASMASISSVCFGSL
jgi:RecA/RadA recombinase